MSFTAYDPESGKKIKLIEHTHNDAIYGKKYFYCDEKETFAYNPQLKQLFELSHYREIMKVEIAKKLYYLIGEY